MNNRQVRVALRRILRDNTLDRSEYAQWAASTQPSLNQLMRDMDLCGLHVTYVLDDVGRVSGIAIEDVQGRRVDIPDPNPDVDGAVEQFLQFFLNLNDLPTVTHQVTLLSR